MADQEEIAMEKAETFVKRENSIVGVSAVYCFEDCECVLVAPDIETLRRMWGQLNLQHLKEEHCQHVLITEDKLRGAVPETTEIGTSSQPERG